MKARPDLEQRRDAAVDGDAPGIGLDDAREQLEQRRLARTVAPDDADGLPVRDLERDAVERCELVVHAAAAADDRRLERRLVPPIDAVALLGIVDGDRRARHSSSTTWPFMRLNAM